MGDLEKEQLRQEPENVPRLRMPSRLVLVRHGESEANVVQRAIKEGIISEYPEGFSEIPDREFRLSRRGREQAILTGPWLGQQYPDGFDVIYVSDHVRARETAALICESAGWTDCQIRIDPMLGERSWGNFPKADEAIRNEFMSRRKRDPLNAPLPDGESLLFTRLRARQLIDKAALQFPDKRVLVFSHGEYIEAFWSELAHWSTEKQTEYFHSPEGDIKNCQVVEFGNANPRTDQDEGLLRWVRSSCPASNTFHDWAQLSYQKFTPAELMAFVEKYPHLNFDEIGDAR